MFECLSEHLEELTSVYRSKLLTLPTSSSDDITEQTDRQMSTDVSVLPDSSSSTSSGKIREFVRRVNLLDLLTDASRKMREKEHPLITQYANLCYTVDRNSQQIFIDIFKPSSESE
ncbi:hypothetical protein EB796_012923 [Bugula neritina]|uniref:Uncharacterized protein n=1 Tax=Bugula neritina TaxID=10212 RepID=A0A7J7JR07_BUGNE|nr:hypothetical protein EB796_012923 [Bugula neritina]